MRTRTKKAERRFAEAVPRVRGLAPDARMEVLLEALEGKSRDELERLEVMLSTVEGSDTWSPQTRRELWRFIRDEMGYKIPHVAVCEGHCSPFDLVADCYFEDGLADKLAIGSRGSSKTLSMAVVHALNARFKRRHQGATVASVLSQSKRCWGYFGRITQKWRPLLKDGRPPAMGHTEFQNGSEVEIITGTMQGVNSPHPNLGHFDEIELWDPEVYEEALNMTQSTHGHRALNVRTSSWKKVRGMVTRFVEEVQAARRDGVEPPLDIYVWCVFETTQRCDERCAACPFASVIKGRWEDGTPRTFEDVCKGWTSQAARDAHPDAEGKLKRSRGFATVEDAIRRFRTLSRRMWEAQQESRRPTAEGLIYAGFDEVRHVVEEWEPSFQDVDPDGRVVEVFYGQIDVAVDFGGTNPTAIQLWQQLDVAVTLDGKLIPEGSAVLIDEFYETGVSSTMSGVWLNRRVAWWDRRFPGFAAHVQLPAVRDPAAKDAALNWHSLSKHGAGADSGDAAYYIDIPTAYRGGQDREDGVALVQERIERDLVYVDRIRCPRFLDEIGGYDQEAFRRKEDDHHMDALRYRMVFRHAKERRRQDPGHVGAAPRPRAAVSGATGREWHPGAMSEYEPYQGTRTEVAAKAPPDAPRVAAGPPRRRTTRM